MTTPGGVVLDAGAFLALERRQGMMVHLARRFIEARTPLATSAGVIAQIWRGGARDQAPVSILLRQTEVVDLTYPIAKILGRILGLTRTSDPIDAHVVLIARERAWPVLTSDVSDLLAIDPDLVVERI